MYAFVVMPKHILTLVTRWYEWKGNAEREFIKYTAHIFIKYLKASVKDEL